MERETVTGTTMHLDLGAPTRAGDDVYIDTDSGQCGGQMPTVTGFAPPTGRNLVGGNQRLQRPVTPEFEPLVPADQGGYPTLCACMALQILFAALSCSGDALSAPPRMLTIASRISKALSGQVRADGSHRAP